MKKLIGPFNNLKSILVIYIMITCNLMGGLGNQLFQIFATISYAIKTYNEFKFTDAKTLGGGSTTKRNTYWDSFFSELKLYTTNKYPPLHIIREKEFSFNELPINEMINNNVIIHGYFQSYKYFYRKYDAICNIIGLEKKKNELISKISDYNQDYFNNMISMHFRIGDYKNIQHVHPVMTKEYYNRCLNWIQSMNQNTKFTIVYFCEDADLDDAQTIISYLSQEFELYEFIRGENSLEDWEQMLLMSCCHHNIIANSSFSWWAAYFNSYEDKIICYPSMWFGPNIEHNTKDLCPPEWKKIET